MTMPEAQELVRHSLAQSELEPVSRLDAARRRADRSRELVHEASTMVEATGFAVQKSREILNK